MMTSSKRGSLAYENWRAEIAGETSRSTAEFPLFTDARLLGADPIQYGPYTLFNAMPFSVAGSLQPAIVLRLKYHSWYDSDLLVKTNVERYHGGVTHDEIAALVSLCLGIRLKAGGMTRIFQPIEDPRGHPTAWEVYDNPILSKPEKQHLILPRALGDRPLADTSPLARFPNLTAGASVALVRAARLYQDALWIVESAPELSWLMLVSAVEAAAGHWRQEKDPPLERMRSSRPELEPLLKEAGGEELVQKIAELIAPYMGSTKKFTEFLLEFLPPEPQERPPEYYQVSWKPEDLKKPFGTIYKWRSLALHNGTPFPMPMCEAPGDRHDDFLKEQPGSPAIGGVGGSWAAKDMPMLLHTFEYIVRHALLRWWRSIAQSDIPETATDESLSA
jgi:hypothetical protein